MSSKVEITLWQKPVTKAKVGNVKKFVEKNEAMLKKLSTNRNWVVWIRKKKNISNGIGGAPPTKKRIETGSLMKGKVITEKPKPKPKPTMARPGFIAGPKLPQRTDSGGGTGVVSGKDKSKQYYLKLHREITNKKAKKLLETSKIPNEREALRIILKGREIMRKKMDDAGKKDHKFPWESKKEKK